MAHAPALHRRIGYQLNAPPPLRLPGITGLPPQDEGTLKRFVSTQPGRVIAELMLESARRQLDVEELIDLIREWVERLPSAAVQVAGADRLPPQPLREVP